MNYFFLCHLKAPQTNELKITNDIQKKNKFF